MIHRQWWLLMPAVVFSVCATLFSCGDAGDSVTRSPSPTSTDDSTQARPLEELRDRVATWSQTGSKVYYHLTVGPGDPPRREDDMVIYWRRGLFRSDVAEAPTGTQTIIIGNNVTYTCSKSSNEAEPSCLRLPFANPDLRFFGSGEQFVYPSIVSDLLDRFGYGAEVQRSTMRISGHDTVCFVLKNIPPSGETNLNEFEQSFVKGDSTWCFGERSIPELVTFNLVNANDPLTLHLGATSVGEALESDFEPPFPVRQFSVSPTPGN